MYIYFANVDILYHNVFFYFVVKIPNAKVFRYAFM